MATARKSASQSSKKSAKKSVKKSAGRSVSSAPHTLSSEERNSLPTSTYAFPRQRKEPLNNASHVRNAIARFDQVKDVSDAERDEAFHHIKSAAQRFGVELTETSWHELGKQPSSTTKSARKSAKKSSH